MSTAVPKKRRVLFIINQFFKGGAETALVNLLRTMDSARFDVDLLIFDMIDLPGSLSLIPEIPAWVHVVNAAENEKKAAFAKKAVFKLERKLTGTQPFRRAAIRYLQNQYYDAAVSYGEWFSSALCARYAAARRKYVWIHADMDRPPSSIRTFCALKRSSTAFSSPPVTRWRGRSENIRSSPPARSSFRIAWTARKFSL